MFRIRIQWVWEGGALLAAYLHVQTHQYIRRGQCGRRGREGEEHTNAMCHLYGDRKMKSRCPSRDKCNDRCAECVCVCVCPLGDKALSLSLTRWFRQWQQARSTLQTPVTTTRSEMRIKLWKMEFRPNQKRITQAQISETQWRKVGQKRAKQIDERTLGIWRHNNEGQESCLTVAEWLTQAAVPSSNIRQHLPPKQCQCQCYSQATSSVSVPTHEYPKAYLLTCRRLCFTLPFDPAHMLSESCWVEKEGAIWLARLGHGIWLPARALVKGWL